MRDSAEFLGKYLYRDDPSADPIVRHAKTVVQPFFWYDVADELRVRRARKLGLPEGLVVSVPGREVASALNGWSHPARVAPN